MPQRPVCRLQEPLEVGQDEKAADLVVEAGGEGGEGVPVLRGERHRGQAQVLHLQPGRSRNISSGARGTQECGSILALPNELV